VQQRSEAPEREDGLRGVRCPYCGWLWYRKVPERSPTVVHETKCNHCKRIVLYRVEGSRVIDLTATELS
jgi:DNA-directed RNA polymerase subunit RPC12/RpoP